MEWILVHIAQGESEAVVIQSVLEAEGIKYKVARESIGKIYGINIDGLGEIKIYVEKDRAEDAKELLKGMDK